jgi:hypothetical protein
MIFLQTDEISNGMGMRLYDTYGERAGEILETDRDRMSKKVSGIGFNTEQKGKGARLAEQKGSA